MYYHNGNRARVAALREIGLTGPEIADRLGISVGAVYNHFSGIKHREKTYNGDENRAKVREAMASGCTTVRQIMDATGLGRGCATHHMKKIKEEECPQQLTETWGDK